MTALALGVEEMRQHGILVRRLEAVETLAAVNVVCFDKTGTLTHGSMSLEVVGIGDRICRRQRDALVDQNNASRRSRCSNPKAQPSRKLVLNEGNWGWDNIGAIGLLGFRASQPR